MTDISCFNDLTPRQQLNDLMHKYAQARGLPYNAGWEELDKRWRKKYGDAVSWLRWKHCQDLQLRQMTLPAFLEETGRLQQALSIAQEMTEIRADGKSRPTFKRRSACSSER